MSRIGPASRGAVVLAVAALAMGCQAASSTASPTQAVTPSPSPAPTVAATPKPTAAVAPSPRQVVIDYPGSVVPITVTLPGSGWHMDGGILYANDYEDTGMLVFSGDLFVYGDPCRWSSTKPASPATTVDEIVSAVGSQASRDASEPVDITVAGHAGKAITVHVPDDAVFSECDDETFGLLTDLAEPDSPARYNQGPGQIDELRVVDVNEVPVAFDLVYWPDTPQDVIDELYAIVESATFDE